MEALFDSFIFFTIIKALVIFAVLMTTLAYLLWVERKVSPHVQLRPAQLRADDQLRAADVASDRGTPADFEHAQPAPVGGIADRRLLELEPGGRRPDRQLLHLHHRGVRGNQSRAVRSTRGRERTRR